MREIAEMTRRIVERAKNRETVDVPGDYETLSTPCPNCGGTVKENYKRFACTNCDFSITKIPGGRQLEIAEAEQLLRERTLGPLQGFRSRLGRPFAAILKLNDENKLEFDFGQAGAGEDDAEPVDFSGQEPLGACPKCRGRVFEHGMSYVCENAVGPGKHCDFRSGKIILQQEVAPAQMRKLLAEGRTDLLTDFVSSRTRRKFKAYLVLEPGGKVGFAFEPRAAKKAAAKATAPETATIAPSAPAARKTPAKSARTDAATTAKSAARAGSKAPVKTAARAGAQAPAKTEVRPDGKTTAKAAPKKAAKKPAASSAASSGRARRT